MVLARDQWDHAKIFYHVICKEASNHPLQNLEATESQLKGALRWYLDVSNLRLADDRAGGEAN